MKRLSGWDTYVREAKKAGDRSIELPLTEDESYIISYPTRGQGRKIARAQAVGDTDALLVAMLGEDAGKRVQELAEDEPAFVLDEFLIDVMKKFGMIPDDDEDDDESPPSIEDRVTTVANGQARNGRTAGGKARVTRKSTSSSKRSSAASP